MEGAFIGYCSWFGQKVGLLQVNLQKAFDSIVFWDSVPQTSIYSNSNSAVVEPPGGGCNILPRSQVPILGLYYATISTIATSLVLEHVGLLRKPTCGGSSALFSISFSGHVA